MSLKNASLRTLLEDLKVGFKFTLKNIISFVLGMIGVLILTGLLMALIIAVILITITAQVGFPGMISWVMDTFSQANQTTGMVLVGSMAIVVLPLLLPIFIAIGALFGMGREIIESNGTSAEGVFAWYKSKFMTLAAGGTITYLIVIGPPIILAVALSLMTGSIFGNGTQVLFAICAYLWILLSTGLLSMLFPAIIDGLPVIESLKTSIRLAVKYPDRVFSTWFAYVFIGILMTLPFGVGGLAIGPAVGDVLAGYAVLFALALVFIVFPAATITLNRVYMILNDETVGEMEEDSPQIELVGGV